jgi:hypothetical protein
MIVLIINSGKLKQEILLMEKYHRRNVDFADLPEGDTLCVREKV